VLLTPYPPGIPLLIPGERFNRTIVEYLKFARKFNAQFPGFDTDIHGLVAEPDGPAGPVRYFMDCVRQKRPSADAVDLSISGATVKEVERVPRRRRARFSAASPATPARSRRHLRFSARSAKPLRTVDHRTTTAESLIVPSSPTPFTPSDWWAGVDSSIVISNEPIVAARESRSP
jgi:hypothetical protein